jgi:hypothetical protein
VCLQDKRGWAGTQPAGWVAFPAAVDAVARYHKEVTYNASWDGLYLDDAGSGYDLYFASKVGRGRCLRVIQTPPTTFCLDNH